MEAEEAETDSGERLSGPRVFALDEGEEACGHSGPWEVEMEYDELGREEETIASLLQLWRWPPGDEVAAAMLAAPTVLYALNGSISAGKVAPDNVHTHA